MHQGYGSRVCVCVYASSYIPGLYVTVSEKTCHIACSMTLTVFFKHRANLLPSLRQIVLFTLELERFVHDHATSIENEKLRSEGVAMYAYSISVYYT